MREPEIDLNQLLKRWTMIARYDGVRLKNKRLFKLRLWLYLRLFRLAAKVAGMDFEEVIEVDNDE